MMDNLWVFGPLYILPALFLMNSWITNANGIHGTARWQYDFQNRSAGWYSPTFPNYAWGLFLGIGIFAIVLLVVSIAIQIMLEQAQLEVSEQKTPQFGKLWATVKQLGLRMVGLYLLVGLYILVGLILFIIPGLIMIRRYYLAPYVLLDKKCGIKEAMEYSAAISKPHPGAVWGVIGVMVLIGLISIVPFIGGLIAFIVGALYSVAPALRYQELKSMA